MSHTNLQLNDRETEKTDEKDVVCKGQNNRVGGRYSQNRASAKQKVKEIETERERERERGERDKERVTVFISEIRQEHERFAEKKIVSIASSNK